MRTWRYLVFLARGLCACSLAMLYLFIGLVLYPGHHPARTRPPSRLQASLGEESTGSLPSPIAEDIPPATPETACVDFDTSFNSPYYSRFSDGQPLVLNPQESDRPLIIPKIVVQDFSAEDGSVSYKATEYDLTETLKRRKRLSWVHVSTTLGDRLPPNTRPSSLGPPPTTGVSTVGGLRPLYLVEGFKRRQSNVSVQKLLKFPGRKRGLGDTVAKDGSFVIVGM